MTKILVCVLVSFGLFVTAFDYKINYERLVLSYYDKNLVDGKNALFLFKKYNRTNFCLNVSFTTNEDIDGRQLKFKTSVRQLLSGRYKDTGIELSLNVCEYWQKDIYGTSTHIKQFGNIEACDIKKGHYYLYNYMPDESVFPKFVPLGEYMVKMDVNWLSGKPILGFEWYVTCTIKINNKVYKG